VIIVRKSPADHAGTPAAPAQNTLHQIGAISTRALRGIFAAYLSFLREVNDTVDKAMVDILLDEVIVMRANRK
jgi:hypothetical protein